MHKTLEKTLENAHSFPLKVWEQPVNKHYKVVPHSKSDVPCPQTQMPLLLSLLLQVCRMLLNYEYRYLFVSPTTGLMDQVTVYHLSGNRNQRHITDDIEQFYPCT
jgi:hypothetical protein